MKQIDLWGSEVEIKEGMKTDNKPKTIKGKFREKNGYIDDEFCKDCIYFVEYKYRHKKYFKCQEMGVSMSNATDIRKKDNACNLFRRRNDG